MRIVVKQNTPPRLEAPEDFKRFSIALDERLQGSEALALAPVADFKSEEGTHAWVRPDAIRALSAMAGDPEWDAGFAAMCAFAKEHGWVGQNGGIRAHIDYLPEACPVSADEFRSAMRKFASGVCIVASGKGADRRGMTVSAFSSVSAEPPMVLVCLNRASSTHDAIISAEAFSVNILGGSQEDVAMRFAGQGGLRGADRFTDDAWQDAEGGAPVLATSHQSLVCTPVSSHQAGTHTVLFGQVIATGDTQDSSALVNYDGVIKATTAQPSAIQ